MCSSYYTTSNPPSSTSAAITPRTSPTMPTSECRSNEADDLRLHKKLADLEQDWSSYKQSISGHRRRSNAGLNHPSAVAPNIHDLLSRSPEELLLSLQQPDSPPSGSDDDWKPKTAERDAEQIVAERRAAVRNGRLRGRRLLEALECARDESALAAEVSLSSCCSTTSNGWGDDGSVRVLSVSSSSSSSSSTLSSEAVAEIGEESYGGRRSKVRIMVLLVLVVLVGVVILREFGVEEEYGECMVPT